MDAFSIFPANHIVPHTSILVNIGSVYFIKIAHLTPLTPHQSNQNVMRSCLNCVAVVPASRSFIKHRKVSVGNQTSIKNPVQFQPFYHNKYQKINDILHRNNFSRYHLAVCFCFSGNRPCITSGIYNFYMSQRFSEILPENGFFSCFHPSLQKYPYWHFQDSTHPSYKNHMDIHFHLLRSRTESHSSLSDHRPPVHIP